MEAFRRVGLDFEPRVLPCGHYTTGETPYKFIDGWYMGSFVYRAFKALREEKATSAHAAAQVEVKEEEDSYALALHGRPAANGKCNDEHRPSLRKHHNHGAFS